QSVVALENEAEHAAFWLLAALNGGCTSVIVYRSLEPHGPTYGVEMWDLAEQSVCAPTSKLDEGTAERFIDLLLMQVDQGAFGVCVWADFDATPASSR